MLEDGILLEKFEKIKGFSGNLFDSEEWREFDSFVEGYNLAQKEFETERQYWLDKENTDLRTVKEMLDCKYSKEELFTRTLEAVNIGMVLRQNQLNGFSYESGNDVHKEWFEKIKK